LPQNTDNTAPKLDVIETKYGKLYRVTYAGMTREHYQEWQAKCWYEQVLDMWRHRVKQSAVKQYLASQLNGYCSDPLRDKT
jgi:ribosomal protein S3AE